MHRDTKIAVIGGGASGLSAAYLLVKAGYRSVTVLEKDSRVGGKCKTVFIDSRSYELGGILHLRGMEPISGFIRELGIETMPGTVIPPPPPAPSPLFDMDRLIHIGYPRKLQAWIAAIRFTAMELRNPSLCCPGHENMPADLTVPLSEWLKANRLTALEPLFACWMSGFGYGYTDNIPAAYALKFCSPAMIWKTMAGGLRGFTRGYQEVWDRVAPYLDVRLSHSVRRIIRRDNVVIETDSGNFVFDKVILGCDLRAIAPALDQDEEESELIRKIRSHRYHVVLAETEKMPSRVAFLYGHFSHRLQGAAVCWYHRWADRNLYNFYAIAPDEMSTAEVHARIRASLSGLGATIGKVISSENWSYFPRVSSHDLTAGFYRRLEARQGQRHTYYAGEIMHFPSVDLLAGYSAHLVRRHFA